jgi:hypothetical protein
VIGFPVLLVRNVTVRDTRSEQEKDLGKPVRLGVTVNSQDDAYLSEALRTTLPPVFGTLVFEAVNDSTTGTGRAPSAACGVLTRATVATTIGTTAAIASFDRTLEENMGHLASVVDSCSPQASTDLHIITGSNQLTT